MAQISHAVEKSAGRADTFMWKTRPAAPNGGGAWRELSDAEWSDRTCTRRLDPAESSAGTLPAVRRAPRPPAGGGNPLDSVRLKIRPVRAGNVVEMNPNDVAGMTQAQNRRHGRAEVAALRGVTALVPTCRPAEIGRKCAASASAVRDRATGPGSPA